MVVDVLPEGFHRSRYELALGLLEDGVVEFSDANFSFNVEKLTPHLHALTARCMAHIRLGKQLPCDSVYGLDKTDVALAEAFSHTAGVKRIDLDFRTGHRCSVVMRHHGGPTTSRKVLILRHQARTGLLIRKMVSEVRETTAEAGNVITLLDWEDGAAAVLAKQDAVLHAVFSLSELLDIYVRAGKLTTYRRASIGWNAAYA